MLLSAVQNAFFFTKCALLRTGLAILSNHTSLLFLAYFCLRACSIEPNLPLYFCVSLSGSVRCKSKVKVKGLHGRQLPSSTSS